MQQQDVLNSITEALRTGFNAGTPVVIPAEHRNVHPKVQSFLLMRKVDRFAPTKADMDAWTDVVQDIRIDRYAMVA